MCAKFVQNTLNAIMILTSDPENQWGSSSHFEQQLYLVWSKYRCLWDTYAPLPQPISHTSAATFHSAFTSVIGGRTDMHKVRYVLHKVEWNSVGTDMVSTKHNV